MIPLLILSFVDERTINELNVWIKPMKFALSIAIYVWTIAWYIHYLPLIQRPKIVITNTIVTVMVLEYICLIIQAARGVKSHFNTDTPFDSIIYMAMGLLIIINTIVIVYIGILFFTRHVALPRAYLWGIRLGFIFFLLFSIEGVFMNVGGAHSVGTSDAIAGIPWLNWSTTGGDLRIAHFIGMHALQIIPIFAFIVGRFKLSSSAIPVFLFAMLYAALAIWIFVQAMNGQSFFG